ncbi:MAG: response regulator [Ignavibacteriaceae bacterium]
MKSGNSIRTILIAEDSPTQADELTHILEKHNYIIIFANNGKEALKLIYDQKPSLVISDIVMPEMNGYELCKHIKSDNSIRDIPVILLTSLSNTEDLLEGISCGADNFLTKPFNENYLISHIEQIYANKRIYQIERIRNEIEITFKEKKHLITSDHLQVLTLLLSTYEAAVCKNKELMLAQENLELWNENLEELVDERTAELSAEIDIRKSSEEHVNKLNRIYSLISNIDQAIVRRHDTTELLKDACLIAINEGKFPRAGIGIVNNETKKIVVSASAGLTNDYFNKNENDLGNKNPFSDVIRTGKPLFSNNINSDNHLNAIWKQNSLSLGFRSFVAFPLIVLEKVIGGFVIYSNEVDFFDKAELRLLDQMADDISFALEYIQKDAEHKLAEETLLKLKKAVDNSGEIIFMTDKEGIFTFVNPAFTSAYGFTSDEILGKVTPRILKSGLLTASDYQLFWETIKNGNEVRNEYINKRKDDTLFNVGGSVTPIFDEKKNILGFLGIQQDITERKRAEKVLIEAKDKAEEMNRLKSSFFANMSHELRTPLIGINGFSEFILESEKDPALKEMAGYILTSGQRLSETLNLILDITKFESDRIDFKLESIELVSETEEIINSFKETTRKKEIKLTTSFSSTKIYLNTDKRAYRTVINNLINNAIKYTHEGDIAVRVSNNDKFIEIKVMDTGIGIAKKDHEIIFEEFRQASEGFKRNFEGTGLGLSITKKLVEKFGGNIIVESELGKGSTFIVKLPITVEAKIMEKMPKEIIIDNKLMELVSAKRTALLIDDDYFVIKILKGYIGDLVELEWATDAELAIKQLKNEQYDIVFMDINLRHGLDGVQATKEIRKLKGYESIPIIAVTAYAFVGDKEEFLAAGCSHYLSKPFTKQGVLSLMEDVLKSINKV